MHDRHVGSFCLNCFEPLTSFYNLPVLSMGGSTQTVPQMVRQNHISSRYRRLEGEKLTFVDRRTFRRLNTQAFTAPKDFCSGSVVNLIGDAKIHTEENLSTHDRGTVPRKFGRYRKIVLPRHRDAEGAAVHA